jgi:hypothetical protein
MQNFEPSISIIHVVTRLTDIIQTCTSEGLRHGYFAVLYKHMTLAVQKAILEKKFDDNERMERLDVYFADRYLEAWHQYRNGEKTTKSWRRAFDAAQKNDLIVFQHLLLGVNAHINLDLAIAAAKTSPGIAIKEMKHDFDLINKIIASLTGDMQNRLGRISWPMNLIRNIMDGRDESVIEFSITKARKASWTQAVALAQTATELNGKYIMLLDDTVSAISNRVISPGKMTTLLLKPIKWAESGNVAGIIKKLER